jgi:hypothetical protein
MNRITVDHSLGTQLAELDQPVELVDEAGRRLGQFVPTVFPPASDECPYSAAELEETRREEGGCSLADIWRSLGAK